MDCPRQIKSRFYPKWSLPQVVVANQALHENTKVRGPGVEATTASPMSLHTPRSGPMLTKLQQDLLHFRKLKD